MARHPDIQIKRVYEQTDAADGARVLVDRVWPRGIKKDEADLELWLKDVAPSTELRHWFGHDPERWSEFQRRYRAELERNPEPIAKLRDLARHGRLTLLYGARDTQHNQAVVLADYLMSGAQPGKTSSKPPQGGSKRGKSRQRVKPPAAHP
jgi:uncharacterized protein YeaO (DUF488 family)